MLCIPSYLVANDVAFWSFPGNFRIPKKGRQPANTKPVSRLYRSRLYRNRTSVCLRLFSGFANELDEKNDCPLLYLKRTTSIFTIWYKRIYFKLNSKKKNKHKTSRKFLLNHALFERMRVSALNRWIWAWLVAPAVKLSYSFARIFIR